jgi:hypothetical protein
VGLVVTALVSPLFRCGIGCYILLLEWVGVVQRGLIMSIHFSRKGDAALSTVTSLFRHMGYGNDNCLRTQLDVLVLLDRGYHIASVLRFLLSLKCQLLGTQKTSQDGVADARNPV